MMSKSFKKDESETYDASRRAILSGQQLKERLAWSMGSEVKTHEA